uniref:Uncharacterized protein n=1 Tax=Anopheles maculatus TaxID=74869 RepID=A0A182SM07_9DIPT
MAETPLEDSDRKARDDDGRGSQEASLTPRPPNPLAMYRTIAALLSMPPIASVLVSPPSPSAIGLLRRPRSPPPPPPPSATAVVAAATNTNSSAEEPEKNLICGLRATQDLSSLGTIELQSLKIVTDLTASDEIVEYACEYNQKSQHGSTDLRNVPVTLDLPKANAKPGRKRKFPSSRTSRRNHSSNDIQSNLNEIIEECEYDSDIGKFRCRTIDNETGYGAQDYEDSETSLTSCDDDQNGVEVGGDENGDAFTPTNAQPPSLSDCLVRRHVSSNDLDTPIMGLKSLKPETNGNENFNIIQSDVDSVHAEEHKVVTKRIEFFENAASTGRKILNCETQTQTNVTSVGV